MAIEQKTDSIELGYVAGVFSFKGYLKIFSYCQPIENIASYSPLILESKGRRQEYQLEDWKSYKSGKSIIIKFKTIDSEETASLFVGHKILTHTQSLPKLDKNGYYLKDLIGLEVINTSNQVLGQVIELLDNGVHKIIRVSQVLSKTNTSTLIPMIDDVYIINIDLSKKKILVNWDYENL